MKKQLPVISYFDTVVVFQATLGLASPTPIKNNGKMDTNKPGILLNDSSNSNRLFVVRNF